MTMRFVQDLIPELADTIITSHFDLRIHADDLLEYQKYSVLERLQQAQNEIWSTPSTSKVMSQSVS